MKLTTENVTRCLDEMVKLITSDSFLLQSEDGKERVKRLAKIVRIEIFDANDAENQTIRIYDNSNNYCGTGSVLNRNAIAVVRPTICHNQLVYYTPVMTLTSASGEVDLSTIVHEGSHLFSYGDYRARNGLIFHHWGSLSSCFRVEGNSVFELRTEGSIKTNELVNDLMTEFILELLGWGLHPKMKHQQFKEICSEIIEQAWKKERINRIDLLRTYISDKPCNLGFLDASVLKQIDALL